MGAAIPRGGPGGAGGSFLQAASLSAQRACGPYRACRRVAAGAQDRRRDRSHDGSQPRHRQPHPHPVEAQQNPHARLSRLPPNRYEFDAPGDMLHIDIKKLARSHKPGHRITGNPQDETRGAGMGVPSTWPSTTTPAWPTPP